MLEAADDRRWLFRIGGGSAVAGALLGLVGNLIHPATAGPNDPEATARVVAESRLWIPVHLALLVAFVLMLGGLVAIHDAIGGALPGALARFGLASAVVGTAVGVVLISLDGFAAKHLAEAWLAVPAADRATAIGPFQAEDSINFALLSPWGAQTRFPSAPGCSWRPSTRCADPTCWSSAGLCCQQLSFASDTPPWSLSALS